MSDRPQPPAAAVIRRQVAEAVAEDVGAGDLTAALLPGDLLAEARVIAREQGVICGCDWFDEVFRQIDAGVVVEWLVRDADRVVHNQPLCLLHGRARSLLTAERTALNFLQTLSGTASATSRYVEAVAGTGVRILDTRKTLPGMRLAQKYAVRCGGGDNHRIGLYDAVLIKENHIRAAGSIAAVMHRAQHDYPGIDSEIEVESLQQLQEALEAGAKRILLDNFPSDALRSAVALNRGRARLEVSGGVDLDAVRELAETGVDDISVGALTKHLRAFDLSMLFV